MYRQSPSAHGISLYTPGVIPEELREQFGNAAELVCIQVPKVYDSCLLRLCLVGDCKKEDIDKGIVFDKDLCIPIDCKAENVFNARVVGLVDGSFKILQKKKVPGDPNKKIITYTYKLKILYDVCYEDGYITKDNCFELKRCETIGPLYCPESKAIIRESKIDQTGQITTPTDEDDEIIKLEIVARVLDATIKRENCEPCNCDADNCCIIFTIGIYNIIKCELMVQLVIPAFGFCPPPAPCEPKGEKEPCEEFNNELPPPFFPPQLDEFISGPGIDC